MYVVTLLTSHELNEHKSQLIRITLLSEPAAPRQKFGAGVQAISAAQEEPTARHPLGEKLSTEPLLYRMQCAETHTNSADCSPGDRGLQGPHVHPPITVIPYGCYCKMEGRRQ